ncbi:MAG: pilus assembly protein [Chloroflexi bacterium]|nr:pilus assembly protein [Chloroflexota bacterium]
MYLPHEEGQGLVEYALLLVFIAMVVLAILAVLGPVLGNAYSRVTNVIPGG